MILSLSVLDGAFLIDHEGRAFRHATHDEIGFGKELLISNAVIGCGFVLVVREEGEFDAFLFDSSCLCEGVVPRDSHDGGIKSRILGEFVGNCAEFFCANPSESHGDEEQNDILLPDVLGESEDFGAVRA